MERRFNDITVTFYADKAVMRINENELVVAYKVCWTLPVKWRWGVFVYDSFADYRDFETIPVRESIEVGQ